MRRAPEQPKKKKERAIRIQELIAKRYGTYYAFRREANKQKRKALASTVRGWIPPQRRWKAKAVRNEDWEALRLPDTASLMQFCEMLDVRSDYVLFGDGSPGRGGNWTDHATLVKEVEAIILRSLGDGWHVDGAAVLREATAWAHKDVGAWEEWQQNTDHELGRGTQHIVSLLENLSSRGVKLGTSIELGTSLARIGYFASSLRKLTKKHYPQRPVPKFASPILTAHLSSYLPVSPRRGLQIGLREAKDL